MAVSSVVPPYGVLYSSDVTNVMSPVLKVGFGFITAKYTRRCTCVAWVAKEGTWDDERGSDPTCPKCDA